MDRFISPYPRIILYTCDGKQIPELPSLCASQEVLVSIAADGQTFSEESDGWIDVPKLVAEYLR